MVPLSPPSLSIAQRVELEKCFRFISTVGVAMKGATERGGEKNKLLQAQTEI